MIKVDDDIIKAVILYDENNTKSSIKNVYINENMVFDRHRRNDYITDGLAFHLDGFNKGSNENAWTDLIGGIVFENHGAEELYNGWRFSSNAYLYNDIELTQFEKYNYTIECCVTPLTANSIYIFSSKCPAVSAYIYKPDRYSHNWTVRFRRCETNNGEGRSHGIDAENMLCWIPDVIALEQLRVSGHEDFVYVNGIRYEPHPDGCNLLNVTGTTIGNYIPGSTVGNLIIHSLRIYNRRLDEEEILHNQEVDLDRFYL